MSNLPIVVTDTGLAGANSADGLGLQLRITKIALGSGDWAPDESATVLHTPVKELSSFGATELAPGVLHITIRDDSLDVYDLREIGLIDEEGNLFGVYAQSDIIASKTTVAGLLISATITLTRVPLGSVTFIGNEFDYNPATEELPGVVEIATSAEVAEGTDNQRVVTPKTLTERLGGAGFVAGTRMLFMQSAAPLGWTKLTTHHNKALRVVSGESGGEAGGSVDFTAAFKSQTMTGTVSSTVAGGSVSVGSRTLTNSSMPSHAHTANGTGSGNNAPGTLGTTDIGSRNNLATSNAGSGLSHNHSGYFSGAAHSHSLSSSSIDLAVKYVDAIICQKDAA